MIGEVVSPDATIISECCYVKQIGRRVMWTQPMCTSLSVEMRLMFECVSRMQMRSHPG